MPLWPVMKGMHYSVEASTQLEVKKTGLRDPAAFQHGERNFLAKFTQPAREPTYCKLQAKGAKTQVREIMGSAPLAMVAFHGRRASRSRAKVGGSWPREGGRAVGISAVSNPIPKELQFRFFYHFWHLQKESILFAK